MGSRTEPSVFVVDDEPALALALALWLRRSGMEAETCTSSLSALERLSAGERFDVVLCDVQMPGLRGIELLLRARLTWPELEQRIIFMSGGLLEDDRRFLREHGLRLLEKPLASGHELESAIRELVARVGLLG